MEETLTLQNLGLGTTRTGFIPRTMRNISKWGTTIFIKILYKQRRRNFSRKSRSVTTKASDITGD
jgi:hypothetical protein